MKDVLVSRVTQVSARSAPVFTRVHTFICAPDFFHIPSDRVVELGAQMKV